MLKAERENGKVAGQDVEVQATWTKFREESAAMSKKVADSRRSLKTETQFVDQSVNAGGRSAIDVTRSDGEVAWKDVTVSAPVRLPSGETVQKTLVLTLQRAVLKGEKDIDRPLDRDEMSRRGRRRYRQVLSRNPEREGA